MLILYTRLFGKPQKQSESKTKPSQITSNPSETELETQNSAHRAEKQLAEEMRRIRETYYIERRFL